jgi:hypothetical protein
MAMLFTILTVAGFLFHMLSSFGMNYAERIAWGCWFASSVIWAAGRLAV